MAKKSKKQDDEGWDDITPKASPFKRLPFVKTQELEGVPLLIKRIARTTSRQYGEGAILSGLMEVAGEWKEFRSMTFSKGLTDGIFAFLDKEGEDSYSHEVGWKVKIQSDPSRFKQFVELD